MVRLKVDVRVLTLIGNVSCYHTDAAGSIKAKVFDSTHKAGLTLNLRFSHSKRFYLIHLINDLIFFAQRSVCGIFHFCVYFAMKLQVKKIKSKMHHFEDDLVNHG